MPVQAVQFVFSLDRLTRTVNPSHLEAVAKRLCDGFDRSIILATVAYDGDQIRHLLAALFRDGANKNGKIILFSTDRQPVCRPVCATEG